LVGAARGGGGGGGGGLSVKQAISVLKQPSLVALFVSYVSNPIRFTSGIKSPPGNSCIIFFNPLKCPTLR
jgi:hypothetical protein